MTSPCLINFDPEALSIQARYDDEVARFRAKKRWETLFTEIYLLEPKTDFRITLFSDEDRLFFYMVCHFVSQVGKYVFYRITSDQNNAAVRTLKVSHYASFPQELEVNCSRPGTGYQKNFLLRLLKYFQAG